MMITTVRVARCCQFTTFPIFTDGKGPEERQRKVPWRKTGKLTKIIFIMWTKLFLQWNGTPRLTSTFHSMSAERTENQVYW